ncbi:MAG: phosphoribosyltransferase [Opitutaceae bacterium]
MNARFPNRTEAGRILAKLLSEYSDQPDVLVLALPRGGVPVASEVAQTLNVPLDVFVVRKLGLPGHEELAMGAIASGGVRVLNREVIDQFAISESVLEQTAQGELRELGRREKAYREYRSAPQIDGRIIILVDDGIATGSTMRAAITALRRLRAGRVIVATPIAALSTAEEMKLEVDAFFAVVTPVDFAGVGDWYDDFSQTTDEEVRQLLQQANERLTPRRRVEGKRENRSQGSGQ